MMAGREKALTLELLSVIDARSDITQRHLAARLGVALGLANSYLRRCVHKGLIKIIQAPANRYLYYLTPQGFAEKGRLTAEYITSSFDFYRSAGHSVMQALRDAETRGARRVLFVGISELAEIALVRSQDIQLEIIGTYAPNATRSEYLGRPVWSGSLPRQQFDVVMLTALKDCGPLYFEIARQLDSAQIYVPDLIKGMIAVQLSESKGAP